MEFPKLQANQSSFHEQALVMTPPDPAQGDAGGPPQRRRHDRRWLLMLLTLLAVGIGCAIVWREWLRPEFFPRNLGTVKEGAIYRSAQHSPRVLRRLCAELHIKTIVDLGGAEGYDEKTQAQRDLAAELGIERFEFRLPSDGTGDPEKYLQALLLMGDPARQPVLVHCGSGAQRTSTATLLYRMVIEGRSAEEAYPESFGYGHEPEEWILLAWIADHIDYIREGYQRRAFANANPIQSPDE
jgi:hypothetical protein